MSPQPLPSRRPRWRRWLKWPLRFGAALLLLVGAFGCFPNQTLNPTVRHAAPWIAARFGWQLEIDALRGAPWTRWEAQGVSLQPKEDGGPFRIEELGEVHVSLHQMPWRAPRLSDLREIWLRDAQVSVRVAPAEDPPTDANPGPAFPWEPNSWPRVDVDGLSLQLDLPGQGQVHIPNLRLGMQAPPSGAEGERQASLKLEGAQFQPSEGAALPFAAQIALQLSQDRITIEEAEVRPGAGFLRAEGVWPMTQAGTAGAQFSLRWQELAVGPWQDMHGVARALWTEGEWRLPELQAHVGDVATVHGEELAMPWDGGPRWERLQGQIVVGGANLDALLERAAGGSPQGLGRYRLRARRNEQGIAIEDAQATWQAPGLPGPVTLRGQGGLELFDNGAWKDQPTLDLRGPIECAAGNWTNPQGVAMQWPQTAGSWELQGTFPDWDGAILWEDLRIEVTPTDQPQYLAQGRLDVRLAQGSLQLHTLDLQWTQGEQSLGRIQASGDFGSLRDWQADARSVALDWQAQAQCPQLFPLAHFVPQLRRIEGRATANMEGAGTLSRPTWNGSGELQATSLRWTDGESWSDVNAHWTLNQTGRAQAELQAQYGGAPLTVQAALDWSGPQPRFEADLHSDGAPILRTPDARLRADVRLHLEGTPDQGKVTGSAQVVYGRLRHQFDLSGKLLSLLENRERGRTETGEPLNLQWNFPQGWSADVDLTTAEPVPVYSDLGKTDISLQAKVVGRSGLIYPEGSLVVGTGKVALPGATLTWNQGVLLFPQGGGAPQIEASGSTRLAGHDITLAVSGELTQPTLELSSVPYRPQYDLMVLLLTGSLPGGNDLSRATQSLSVYLAKDLLRRWLGSEPSEEEGLLDRLEITTGREVSESGLGTLEAMFRVTGDSSQEGRALWITAERDRYEDMNFGLRWVLRPK